MTAPLEADLLAAHERKDQAALVDLYQRAASEAVDAQARAFFLTHAMVFALELGHPAAEAIRSDLIAMGCDVP